MFLWMGYVLDLPDVDREELSKAIEWYGTTCKHNEPCTLEAHAKLGATKFAHNVIDMYRELARSQKGSNDVRAPE